MNPDDEKQLRILARLHYVAALLASTIPIFGAAYGALGVAFLLGKQPGKMAVPDPSLGWLPLSMGLFMLLIGVSAVLLNLITARSLRGRKNHTLCLLTSAMNCVHFPLGTALGTFTIIVLCRPGVRVLFEPPRGGRQGGASSPQQAGSSHSSSAIGAG